MSDDHAPASPIFPTPNLAIWGGIGAALLAGIFFWVQGSGLSPLTRVSLIPLFPFAGFVIQIFCGKKLPRWGDWLPTLMIWISFCFAFTLGVDMFSGFSAGWGGESAFVPWMNFSEAVQVNVGVTYNNVHVIMLLMVTMCAFLIHLFSIGYMEGEIRYNRFFAYIGLFTSAMLGLVVSDNLLTFFMCWELMGLCSYLLIGFYFERHSACNASLKAFMTTRVGDTFMFLGIVAIYKITGSVRFDEIFAQLSLLQTEEILGMSAATVIAFCIFLGTVGKSAQFPLQVWLPDAMEGPTPVSALIHAATMVSAGVFLIIKMFPLLDAGNILPIIAFIGGFTALFAAILAIVQTDIKKVLAYSTLSQLGYMVLSIGVGGYVYAFFHLITHACFKAQLFMGSGSVIKAMHHEQEMGEMGGLRKKMPVTALTMYMATAAIAGVPFFSGFLSKDGILAQVLYMGHFSGMEHIGFADFVYRYWAPIAGFGAALLTAFYMFRMMFLTFEGKPRNQEKFDHAKENTWVILVPLSVLAVCSVGYVFQHANWFKTLVVPMEVGMYAPGVEHSEDAHHQAHTIAMWMSIGIAALGILFSAAVYFFRAISADTLARIWPRFIHNTLKNLYYFDWFYIKVVIQKILLPWNTLMSAIDTWVVDRFCVDIWSVIARFLDDIVGYFDDFAVDGLVDGTGGAASQAGNGLRALQNGRIQVYFLCAIAGIGFPLIYFLFWS